MDGFQFDPGRAAEISDNDILPADEYIATILTVEDKLTKNSDGRYLKLELQITQARNPQYVGWKVFDLINYKNMNPKAEEIGWRTLKSISRAIFGDENQRFGTEALIMKKIKIKTVIQDDGQYQNARVRRYSNYAEGLGANLNQGSGGTQAAFAPAPQQQRPQQQQQRQQPNAGQVQPAAQGYQQQRPAQQQRYQQQPQQQQNFNDDDVPF
jgi:hypothetical protein